MVAVTDRAPQSRREQLASVGCEVVAFAGSGQVPIPELLAELGRRGMTNVLVEGGGRVVGSFLRCNQIDEADVFVAPLVEGGDHARTPVRGEGRELMRDAGRLRDVATSVIGGDVRVQGWLPQPWRQLAGFDDDTE